MSTIETIAKRPRGRPQTRPDAETLHLIAEAARRAFMTLGYGGTSMDAVASDAGVSKKTLYRLVPTKADLFRASVVDRIERFRLAAGEDPSRPHDVRSGLERLLTEFGRLVLAEETIAIQKLVFAEADRFPELASNFYTDAILATYAVLEDYLRLCCTRESIALEDPHLAAGMLRGMMIFEPQRAIMMGRASIPTAPQIAERARACVNLFLSGCLEAETPRQPVD